MKRSKHRSPRRRDAARVVPSPESDAAGQGASGSVPALVASVVTRLRLRDRARALQRLLTPVGPMALTVLGGGVFAKYAIQARWSELQVTLEDAAGYTWGQVFDLVRYVEQANPDAVQQLVDFLTSDATAMAALGASLTALVMQQLAARRGPRALRPSRAG